MTDPFPADQSGGDLVRPGRPTILFRAAAVAAVLAYQTMIAVTAFNGFHPGVAWPLKAAGAGFVTVAAMTATVLSLAVLCRLGRVAWWSARWVTGRTDTAGFLNHMMSTGRRVNTGARRPATVDRDDVDHGANPRP